MHRQIKPNPRLFCATGIVLLAFIMGCFLGTAKSAKRSTQSSESIGKKAEKYDFSVINASDYIQDLNYTDKNLVTAPTETVTDADVDAELTAVLKNYPIYNKITDRAVRADDRVNIDYTARIGDTVISTETGGDIDTGSGDNLKEIADSLIGRTSGEQYPITVRLPENYEGTYTDSSGNKQSLSGAEAEFLITVNYIYGAEKTMNTITDADISVLTGGEYQNCPDFKESLKQQLISTQEAKALQSAWESMIDKCTVIETRETAFKELVDLEYAYELDYYLQIANAGGTDLDTLAVNYGYNNADAFQADIYADSEKIVRHYLIALMIAEKEELLLTDASFRSAEEALLSEYGVSSVDELETVYGKTEVKLFIQLQKVDDFLKNALLIRNPEE